jgi:hypothetical protein
MLFSFPCSCGSYVLVEEDSGSQFFCPECGRIHDMPRRAIPATTGQSAAPAANALVPGKLAAAEAGDTLVDEPVLPDPEAVSLQPVEAGKRIGPDPVDRYIDVSDLTTRPAQDLACGIVSAAPASRSAPPPATPAPAAAVTYTANTSFPPPPSAIPVGPPLRTEEVLMAIHVGPPPLPQARPPVNEHDEFEADGPPGVPRISKRVGRRQAWSRLILGLGFYYGQFLSNLVTLTVLMLGLNIMSLVEEHAQPRLAAFLIGVTALGMFLVGPVLGIVGSVMCSYLPEKVGSRALMWAALGMNMAPMVVGLFFTLFLTVLGGVGLAVITSLLGLMSMYAAWICFMFFLKQVADYLQMAICVDEAANFILWSIPLMVAPPCFLVLAALLADVTLGPVIVFFLITVWLIFNSKYMLGVLNLVSSIRQAIRTRERV